MINILIKSNLFLQSLVATNEEIPDDESEEAELLEQVIFIVLIVILLTELSTFCDISNLV